MRYASNLFLSWLVSSLLLFQMDITEAETDWTSVSMPIYLWLHEEVPTDGWSIFIDSWQHALCACSFSVMPTPPSQLSTPLARLWYISPLSLSSPWIFVFSFLHLIHFPHFLATMNLHNQCLCRAYSERHFVSKYLNRVWHFTPIWP